MATTVTLRRKQEKAKKERNDARRLIKHKLDMVARAVPIEDLPDADASETMQMVINRCTLLWRAAAAEVDRLRPGPAGNQGTALNHEVWRSWDEQGNTIYQSNYWVEMEARLRIELAKVTEAAQKLGLGERRARIAEGQLQVMGEALKAAALTAGLTPEQQRVLGAALRTELSTIEGRALELPAVVEAV